MVIILTVLGFFLGIAEYFVIEIFSYIYDDNQKEFEDHCQIQKYFCNRLKTRISRVILYTKLNKRNQQLRIQLPFVVVITIILALLSYFKFELNIHFYKALFLSSILIIVSIVDMRSHNIPNITILLIALAGSLFILLGGLRVYDSICGMIIGGGIMWLISLIPGAIGGGDVKLMFVLGLFLGFRGVLNAMVIAFLLASIVSLVLLLLKKLGRKDVIAFGPFLAIATIIVVNFINK